MATENWSPVFVLEAIGTDIPTEIETSAFGAVAFGVVSFVGSPDVGRDFWVDISASDNTESWSEISAA